MAQSTPRQNRPFVLAAIAVLVLAAATFAVFSYSTSNQMDRSAASTGSSTDPKAPNTFKIRSTSSRPLQRDLKPTSHLPPRRDRRKRWP